MHGTLSYLEQTDFPAINRNALEILQVNLGYLCNLSCTHCHVNAGPKRTELMDKATVDLVLGLYQKRKHSYAGFNWRRAGNESAF